MAVNRLHLACTWHVTGCEQVMGCMQGADTVIYERLDPNNKLNSALKQMTREHMEMYGEAGLRTLCLSCVELDPDTYNACATVLSAGWFCEYFHVFSLNGWM